MQRRTWWLAGFIVSSSLICGMLYLHDRTLYYRNVYVFNFQDGQNVGIGSGLNTTTSTSDQPHATKANFASQSLALFDKIEESKDAILSVGSTEAAKLPISCPDINATRYGSLQNASNTDPKIEYFFSLSLRQCFDVLPQLLGSVIEAIRFLGPKRCVLSIVEGNSNDGTAELLAALTDQLERTGLQYFLQHSDLNPAQDQRIERLAALRNLALDPLNQVRDRVADDATVIFLNDVAACSEDILELVLQKTRLGADMTCGMDWTYLGEHPTFYDVWVTRDMNGESFFDIPPDGSWDHAWNLLWNNERSRLRFNDMRPFQVYSCWNGAAAFSAKPILESIRFRAMNNTIGECTQGEPQLFCKDLWLNGYGKIAVVPSVNLEYSVAKGELIKNLKGFTSDNVRHQDAGNDRIQWQLDPPDKVKCMPTWANQFWQPWNITGS